MSAENVEMVRAIEDALNRGDIDGTINLFGGNDFEFDFTRSRNPDLQGVHRGPDELRRVAQTLLEPWDHFEWFHDELIEVGECVVRVGGFRARGKGSGVEVVGRGAQVWVFRDGRPVAMRQCQDKEEALEVAAAE